MHLSYIIYLNMYYNLSLEIESLLDKKVAVKSHHT